MAEVLGCSIEDILIKSDGTSDVPTINGHYNVVNSSYVNTDVTSLKAEVKALKMLIEENNLKNPIYVGDTAGDQDACKKAGVPFIYAEYGLGETDTAKYSIKNMKELEQLL